MRSPARGGPRRQHVPEPRQGKLETILTWTVFTGLAVLPLVVSADAFDSFRLVKELALRFEAIVVVALLLMMLAVRGGQAVQPLLRLPLPAAAVLGAAVGWAITASALSTNRYLSLAALGYGGSALAVFAATCVALERRSPSWLLVPIAAGALPNAILAVLQASAVWDPFGRDAALPAHQRVTGFLGNSNDVGAYLALVTVVMVAAAVVLRDWWWWVIATATAVGVMASTTVTAAAALFAGLIVMAMSVSRRRALLVVAVLVVAGTVLVGTFPPLRHRISSLRETYRSSDWVALTSYRLHGVGPALLMFADHPITGVGPGAFKFNYLQYRAEFDDRFPRWYLHGGGMVNFGEVHSDHVQLLAETGLPGYLVFLAAIGLTAGVTMRRSSADSPFAGLVRRTGLSFAVALAVLALGGFPLELAATAHLTASVLAVVAARTDG